MTRFVIAIDRLGGAFGQTLGFIENRTGWQYIHPDLNGHKFPRVSEY